MLCWTPCATPMSWVALAISMFFVVQVIRHPCVVPAPDVRFFPTYNNPTFHLFLCSCSDFPLPPNPSSLASLCPPKPLQAIQWPRVVGHGVGNSVKPPLGVFEVSRLPFCALYVCFCFHACLYVTCLLFLEFFSCSCVC